MTFLRRIEKKVHYKNDIQLELNLVMGRGICLWICYNKGPLHNYVTLGGGWVGWGPSVTRVLGYRLIIVTWWVGGSKTAEFWRYVIMQWPLIIIYRALILRHMSITIIYIKFSTQKTLNNKHEQEMLGKIASAYGQNLFQRPINPAFKSYVNTRSRSKVKLLMLKVSSI